MDELFLLGVLLWCITKSCHCYL